MLTFNEAQHILVYNINHRLFIADVISSLYFQKLMWEENLYFGLLETMCRNLESGVIYRLPVIT